MDKKNLFQIGEVARMFHLSVGSLRHYEKAGLLDFLNQHQFKLSGFSREITLIDDGITNDSSQFVTEIQLPFQA